MVLDDFISSRGPGFDALQCFVAACSGLCLPDGFVVCECWELDCVNMEGLEA